MSFRFFVSDSRSRSLRGARTGMAGCMTDRIKNAARTSMVQGLYAEAARIFLWISTSSIIEEAQSFDVPRCCTG